MVVKVYVSGISGNKEVKKRQQRVILILDSKNVEYELLDIAEPNMEEAKEYMQNNSKLMGGTISDPNPRHPLPPQIFNNDEYCGDYDAFDMANEMDEMEKFLKLAPHEVTPALSMNSTGKIGNGEVPSEGKSKEASPEVYENGKEEEISPENEEEKAPTPQKEKSPSPQKDKSPTPQKEKSPSPAKEEEEEEEKDAENISKEAEQEPEKSDEEA